jgi:membrane-associated protease RseP (regulator of RpoE activity)
MPPVFFLKAVGLRPDLLPVEPSATPLRIAFLANWQEGLLYMGCVLAILLTHEMGHFVMTMLHRVRASLPYFIPLPISPIGTMGAVIAMDGRTANRREIFDIGLAGPIAGLVVALPIMWIGVQRMDFTPQPDDGANLQVPLAMKLAIDYAQPGKYDAKKGFPLTQANPWFMAGWVGLLVTGLNMLPVSQLDGGHVTYALFGRGAHWLARGFMVVAFAWMAYMAFVYRTQPAWVLMAVLVLFLGTDHPPTRDDQARLGPLRTVIGYASLAIPVFCFVPNLQL